MKTIEFYFDYASPFSYLASELVPKRFAGITIDWRPIYLRGLPLFAQGVPYVGEKLTYLTRDLQRVAEHEGIPLAPPVTFPVDGLQALRGAYVAKERGAFDRYHHLAFRACWAESRDIASKDVVIDLLAEATGGARDDLLAAISDAAVKTKLREETERALSRGLFGVPAFFVGDELFWGHDRMDYAARAAAAG